jgi:hypothetical protein
MRTKREELKIKLLEKYAGRDPHPFIQFDAFGDEKEDMWAINTHELMTGAPNVRILITPQTSKKDALRMIKKLRTWIKNADTFDFQQKETLENDKALDREICERCGEVGKHHPLCKTGLTTGAVQEAIQALKAAGDFIF